MPTASFIAARASWGKRTCGRLKREERVAIVQLHLAGQTNERIAAGVGCSMKAVRNVLAADTTQARARVVIEEAAEEAAERWVDAVGVAAAKGEHRPAKDLLAAVGVIQETAVTRPQVVIIGMGQAPAGPDPWGSGIPEKDRTGADEMRALAQWQEEDETEPPDAPAS